MEYIKKADKNSLPARYYYYRNVKKMSKKRSQELAGYKGSPKNGLRVEATKAYRAMAAIFGDILLNEIPPNSVAHELAKNIMQDEDKGAKNTAIRNYEEVEGILGEDEKGEGSQVVNILIKKDA